MGLDPAATSHAWIMRQIPNIIYLITLLYTQRVFYFRTACVDTIGKTGVIVNTLTPLSYSIQIRYVFHLKYKLEKNTILKGIQLIKVFYELVIRVSLGKPAIKTN